MVKFTLKGISNLTESPAYFQQVNGIYRKDGALAYLGNQGRFPATYYTATITPQPEEEPILNIYRNEDLLAEQLAKSDNAFGLALEKQPSQGAKKYAEYALVAAGTIGNLFIIYTLDVEATAFLFTGEPMQAHAAFQQQKTAFGIGSSIGVVGSLPIMAFQAGFGKRVTSLPPKIVALTALPGASSAMLHFYNALATFERLFGQDFYHSDAAIPFKALFGVTGLLSAWAGNVGFFVNDLISPAGAIRLQIAFQTDSIKRGLKTALTCRSQFREPRDIDRALSDYGPLRGDDIVDTSQTLEQLDYLIRQLNLLILLAEVYIPDNALKEFFIRMSMLTDGGKSDNFDQFKAVLNEMG